MTRTKHKRPRNKLASLYVWHRYAGLCAAILVIVLSITGIMLNHTERFQLDQSFIKSNWLLDWYEIELPTKNKSFRTGSSWVTQIDTALYFDKQRIAEPIVSLHGAVIFNEIVVTALDDDVMLLTPEGELIEKLGAIHGVPAKITDIGVTDEGNVVLKAHGEIYIADNELISWIEKENINANWASTQVLPIELKRFFEQDYRQSILTLEKIILDLHSGRILGSWGVYLMDAAAIILLFLAISGSSIWIIQANKKRAHKRKH